MRDLPGERVHVRALDGLRGAAVLGVLAFHLAALDGGDRRGLLGGGWLGVDTFFTLSGYLITSLLLAEIAGSGRVDLRAFWRRRVRRLQPAALVAIAAIVVTAAWWAPAGSATSVRDQAFAALAAVANWQALLAHHAYAAGGHPSAFEHFWSLAVEEQFYLAWPLLLAGLAVLGAGRRAVLRLAVGGAALSWALLATTSLQHGYLRTDTRIGSILAGAALAAVLPLDRRAASPRARRWASVAAGTGLAVTAALWVAAGWPPHAALTALLPGHALATVAVLAGVVLAPRSLPARALGARPLVTVGRVSYGLYLWHWPVFVLCTPGRLGAGWLLTTVVRLALVTLLTAASWFLVEHPVRRDLVLRRTRLALPAAVAATVVVAALAVHAIGPMPAWARADGRVLARATGPAITVSLPPEHPHRVLIVGDSIPTSLMTGPAARALQIGVGKLLDQLADRGIEAWGGTITGCPVAEQVIVIDGEPWRRCLETQREVYPRAMAELRPDLVVWYARQDAYPALLPDGSLDASRRGLEARIRARVAWFAARGAKVALVVPGPNRDGHDADAPRGSAQRSMRLLDRAFHDVAAAQPDRVVGVIRMADLLCRGARQGCPDRMPDGRFFRADDGVHFSHDGALAAGSWLADRIAALDLSRGAAPPVR